MILAITPNVALDRTLVVPGYGAGGVFRPTQVLSVPGGKGLNVARAIRIFGGAVRCGGFLAGHVGALLASLAEAEGLDAHWTMLEKGETRICTILVDPAQEQTSVLNESGAQTTATDWSRLRDDIIAASADADTICICGSLPPGTPQDSFAALLTDLRDLGKAVWVDTSGAGLRAAALEGIHLKVNDDEAAELLGMSIASPTDAAQAAQALAGRAGVSCAITLGKRGAVISDGSAVWHAQPPVIEAKSAVGSGDSFLAGLLVGLTSGKPLDGALRDAAAAGAANALSVGGGQFTTTDFERMLGATTLHSIS